MKTNSERRLNASNKFNKSNKMKYYYRNKKINFFSGSEIIITIRDKNKGKIYYSSQKRADNFFKKN